MNNVLFAIFFEAGRVAMLYGGRDLSQPGAFFVLASSAIDFLDELNWPGEVLIGTRVEKIGRSSFTSRQALFQGNRCAAVSGNVMVQVDIATRRSMPLSDDARAALSLLTRISNPSTAGH